MHRTFDVPLKRVIVIDIIVVQRTMIKLSESKKNGCSNDIRVQSEDADNLNKHRK